MYYNAIQCDIVSSSTDPEENIIDEDPLHPLISYRESFRYGPARPRCRRSYRRITYEDYDNILNVRRSRRLNFVNFHRVPNVPDSHAVPTISHSTRYSLAILAGIFLSSLFGLYIVYTSFPQLTPEEKIHIKIPWNIDDAKNLGTVLDKYKENHYLQVYLGVSMTYIFLQTFAIPGSLFLSVLSGFLFNFFQGLILVCTCSALGATLCFLLSQLVGRKLIFKYFPDKAENWAATVERHRTNLLNYVIFLRVTPFLPNWFINLTAPVIGVPLVPFALGTFIGVAPPSFVALQAGKTLHNMSATDSAFSWASFFMLILFGFLSLIPIYYKDRLKRKFE